MGARPRWAGNRGTGMMAAKGRTGVKGERRRGGKGEWARGTHAASQRLK